MVENKEFVRISLGEYQGWLGREYAGTTLQTSLETLFASGFASQKAITVYPDRQVYRLRSLSPVVNHTGGVKEIYVKRYCLSTIKQFFQTLFRVNKAQKSWRIAKILLKKGILTPQRVAYFTRRASVFEGEHIVVTEGISDGVSLREYVQICLQDSAKLLLKRRLIQSLAEFLAALHQNGIYHGDLTANNIFVSSVQSGRFHIYLIDLDSIRSTHWISARRRLKNLDEFGRYFLDLRLISTSDRIRFLKYYLDAYPQKLTLRQLFNQVWERTQFRLKKYHQQFR